MIDEEKMLYDLFQAYYDARKNKRNKRTALAFEINYESNILQLYDELLQGTYKISPSICFIIRDPVQREVFATDFRDRIVHHLIYNYLYEIFDSQFIYDSYSCRLEKGTHFGVQRVKRFMRACSDNYTKEAYVLKMDIKGFFMNMDKHILMQIVENFLKPRKDKLSVDYNFLIQLIQQTIFHDPTKDCIIKGSKNDWIGLPRDKSLFYSGDNKGLAIGNLTSQLFANIYLDSLDKFVKYQLGFRWYGRYVDDFVIFHQDKQRLLQAISQIRDFLSNELQLILHPKKIYLQDIRKGVLFLGAYIKPYRSYIRKRTIGKFYQKILSVGKGEDKEKMLSTVNSYLGLLSHHKSYRIAKKVWSNFQGKLRNTFSPAEDYTKIKPVIRKLKSEEIKKLYPEGYYNGNIR